MKKILDDPNPNDLAEGFAEDSKLQKKASVSSALKLLPKLIESHCWNQPERSRELTEKIALAIELAHPDVSKGMRRFIGKELRPLSSFSKEKPDNILSFEDARHGFDAVILEAAVLASCRSIIGEHAMASKLDAFGLKPRHRVLLHGAPGNGKTMLAEAFARELNVPFLRVKYGGLIDSHLGASSKNIDLLMDYASRAPCVVFADEFDGIGMSRGDNQDVGEARRITNQLMISLERLPSHTMFIAATNAQGLMDQALLRRFDCVLEIAKPTEQLIGQCARQALDASITPGFDLMPLVPRIEALGLPSLYAVAELCKRIRRDLALNSGNSIEALMLAEC